MSENETNQFGNMGRMSAQCRVFLIVFLTSEWTNPLKNELMDLV